MQPTLWLVVTVTAQCSVERRAFFLDAVFFAENRTFYWIFYHVTLLCNIYCLHLTFAAMFVFAVTVNSNYMHACELRGPHGRLTHITRFLPRCSYWGLASVLRPSKKSSVMTDRKLNMSFLMPAPKVGGARTQSGRFPNKSGLLSGFYAYGCLML